MTPQPSFAALLEGFFTQRLIQQRQASRHTVASYRDTFRLLLQFAQQRLHKAPATLALEDIDAPLVTAFLNELEQVRGVTARTRNLRLTGKCQGSCRLKVHAARRGDAASFWSSR